ncbi:hypothetical protein KVK13_02570 [Helicobacter pylori]|nr:hypothetical protein KVK13_02570 [Helicobacter pylori]
MSYRNNHSYEEFSNTSFNANANLNPYLNRYKFYIHENDELKGYEVIEHKTQNNNGDLMVMATLKKIGSSNDLKAIMLDLKMLKSLLVDVVIDELWRPLFEWEFNNGK